MDSMRYGSVCSGIEAASVAWEPLGFSPAWFSEIEPFPSAVLAHHWPNVANLGDMTALAEMVKSGGIDAPSILVGGTPCQAFSVAGARKGLADERGVLTIKYVELADAIDDKRQQKGQGESIIVWENVPGVLSSKDNAFGAFLGLLSGEECELVPPGGGGQTLVVCLDRKEQSRGASSMPNISEFPNDAVVSLLSQVLETGLTPQEYFLSQKACRGILNRGLSNSRQSIPDALRCALLTCSGLASTGTD